MKVEIFSGTITPLTPRAVPAVAANLDIVILSIDPRGMVCDHTTTVPPGGNSTTISGGPIVGTTQRTHLDIDLYAMGIPKNSYVHVTITIDQTVDQHVAFITGFNSVTAGSTGANSFMFTTNNPNGPYLHDHKVEFYCQRTADQATPAPYNIGLVFVDANDPTYSLVVYFDPKIKNNG